MVARPEIRQNTHTHTRVSVCSKNGDKTKKRVHKPFMAATQNSMYDLCTKTLLLHFRFKEQHRKKIGKTDE